MMCRQVYDLVDSNLTDNFATLSCISDDVLNGHVLFVYIDHDCVIFLLSALKEVVPGDLSS